jgi:hypothetical protein
MSRRIVVVGFVALCALAFSAVTASGAFAKGYTAVLCIAGQGNTDEHCTTGSEHKGNYGHVAIPAGETTQATLRATSTQVLKAELFGTLVELTGTEVEAIGAHIHNNEAGGVMDVTGEGGRLLYSHVTVNIPGCTPEAPGKGPGTVETEPLKVTTTEAGDTELSPVTGEVFAKIHFMAEAGHTCNLPATVDVEGGPVTATLNGATLSVATEEGELTFGEEKEPAFLTGMATVSAGLTGGEHYALALEAS